MSDVSGKVGGAHRGTPTQRAVPSEPSHVADAADVWAARLVETTDRRLGKTPEPWVSDLAKKSVAGVPAAKPRRRVSLRRLLFTLPAIGDEVELPGGRRVVLVDRKTMKAVKAGAKTEKSKAVKAKPKD